MPRSMFAAIALLASTSAFAWEVPVHKSTYNPGPHAPGATIPCSYTNGWGQTFSGTVITNSDGELVCSGDFVMDDGHATANAHNEKGTINSGGNNPGNGKVGGLPSCEADLDATWSEVDFALAELHFANLEIAALQEELAALSSDADADADADAAEPADTAASATSSSHE